MFPLSFSLIVVSMVEGAAVAPFVAVCRVPLPCHQKVRTIVVFPFLVFLIHSSHSFLALTTSVLIPFRQIAVVSVD